MVYTRLAPRRIVFIKEDKKCGVRIKIAEKVDFPLFLKNFDFQFLSVSKEAFKKDNWFETIKFTRHKT